MYLLDIVFKNLNKDSIHILLVTLCSVNDWFLRIQLIVKAFDVITKPTRFMFLIEIGKTLSTVWFIAACLFDHIFKVCLYIPRRELSFSGYGKWLKHLKQNSFDSL